MKPSPGTDPGGAYGAREVSRMLGLSVAQVRAWVRSGLLEPERGPRGEMRFTPDDLTLLQAARGLAGARIGPRRIERALSRLREQVPERRQLAELEISAEGTRIVVTDGSARWQPESGQILIEFPEAAGGVCVPMVRATRPSAVDPDGATAVDFYERGCELEATDPGGAEAAYRSALAIDPDRADTHFNLGVALEDLGRDLDAIDAYEEATALDPGHADAYFNLAGVCERVGRPAAAIRHLKAYRSLLRSPTE
jgi:tetratricopeptide (TPR) repeat protein